MRKLLKILLFSATCCCLHQAQAQSTIFNYQGRLAVNGAPANGLYDFRFTIYKVETNGLVIAGPLTNTAVAVSGGLFMVPLDFGQQPFLGVNRFLDIAVRTNGSSGAFTPLAPRERIASAPYAIAAANVIDGAVTASALSPGPGPDGQVLKMSAGVLTWAPEVASGGTVTSVGTGTGLLGGPITSTGTVAINPAVVPLLNGNQLFSGSNSFTGVASLANFNNRFVGAFTGNGSNLTALSAANISAGTLADARLSSNVPLLTGNQAFTGSNTFNGVSSLTNINNRFVGVFTGNGAGLSNITATATNSAVTMAGDVTGPSSAATVARLRGVNVIATAPAANQVLRYSGTDWTPGAVALATDVSGTLADARLSANVALLNANQTFGGSNNFNGVAALTNVNNRFVGTFTGNGAGLTALNASNISTGTLADARHSTNVALLNTNQIFSGSNTFSGIASLTNVNNRFVGAFTGNGAGLSNVTATATNSVVTMAGDIIGPSSNSLLARIRGVNVSATPPVTGQVLRYNGTSWTPSPVALGSDVSGTLPVANGGTAASTAAGARLSLGAAGSGANADITSLGGLTTPLLATQGGSGLNAYSAGDILYSPAANTLARRAIGTPGQVLGVSNALPTWVAMNTHTHFGQVWSGAAQDGLLLQNTSTVAAASALTAISTATSGLGYGLFGQSASTDGVGVQGFAFATTGLSTGVQGESTSTNGTGVYGLGSASSGVPVGVYGEADAPAGVGVFGIGAATTGTPVGVYGTVSTVNGFGLYTPNRLYVGDTASFVGTVTAAVVSASSFIGSASNLTGINATGITVGTLSDARLSANVALRNATQTFTGANSFSPAAGAPFAVGNTNRVINLNADLVDGLHGTQFLRSDASSTQSVGNLSFAAGTRLLTGAGTAAAPGLALAASPASGMFSPGANILGFATAGVERLRVASDGKVGLGRTATANIFEVEGNASKTAAGSWLANSDARIKRGVKNLEHALETIEHVHPVSFRYTDEYRATHPSIEDKRYCNVIAQEYAEVFPEAVKPSGETLDGKPILQVDVHPAAIYAIAAIQELHEMVKAKDDELAKLKEKNTALEGRLQALEKAVGALTR